MDHDQSMRIHAIHRGRVVVTRDGYQPREGELIAWMPPKRFTVRYDGAERDLTLRTSTHHVEVAR